MAEESKPPQTKGKILVGTSGFSYQDWKGPFYPPTITNPQMLAYYASRFGAVEINATFYAIPGPRSMEGMLRKVGDTFEFVIKAHQDMTHQREKAKDALPRFHEAIKPLAGAGQLGCVLLQFPFSFRNTAENRDFVRFLVEALSPHRVVVEIRNRDWVNDDTMGFLRELKASYCAVDEPRLHGLPCPEPKRLRRSRTSGSTDATRRSGGGMTALKNGTTICTPPRSLTSGFPGSGSLRKRLCACTSSSTITSVARLPRTPKS